jgi:hypothetical protein
MVGTGALAIKEHHVDWRLSGAGTARKKNTSQKNSRRLPFHLQVLIFIERGLNPFVHACWNGLISGLIYGAFLHINGGFSSQSHMTLTDCLGITSNEEDG